MSWISDVYKCRLGMALTVLTRDRLTTVVIEIVLPVGKLPLMICSKQAVSCHVCFNSTPGNRRCTLGIALHDHPPNLFKYMSSIFVILQFKRAYLKFPVSGRSKQASIDRYTHACAMKSR